MFTCKGRVSLYEPSIFPALADQRRCESSLTHPQHRCLICILDRKLAKDGHTVRAALDVAGLRADAAFGDVAWVGSGRFEAEWRENISLRLLTISAPPINIRPHDF